MIKSEIIFIYGTGTSVYKQQNAVHPMLTDINRNK